MKSEKRVHQYVSHVGKVIASYLFRVFYFLFVIAATAIWKLITSLFCLITVTNNLATYYITSTGRGSLKRPLSKEQVKPENMCILYVMVENFLAIQ